MYNTVLISAVGYLNWLVWPCLKTKLCFAICVWGVWGFLGSLAGKESTWRGPWFDFWVRKTRWRRDRLSTAVFLGFPGGSDSSESACSVETWVGKKPWRREQQPTPVFLPRESPWTEEPGGLQSVGSRESDVTERLSAAQHVGCVTEWCCLCWRRSVLAQAAFTHSAPCCLCL